MIFIFKLRSFTAIFMAQLILAQVGLSQPTTLSANSPSCLVLDYFFTGLSRTDEAWLRGYLQLRTTDVIDVNGELDLVRVKLKSTDIFSELNLTLDHSDTRQCHVVVDLKEKWTTIPVVRGAYGGGTPLVVVGGYETNAFGRLYTIGGEVRRYGSMAPGGFLYFKSLRAWGGMGLWGGELWQDRRRRSFYDSEGQTYGTIDSESLMAKFQLLYPLLTVGHRSLQGGLQLSASRESPTSFQSDPGYIGSHQGAPALVALSGQPGYGLTLGPALAYDELSVDGLNAGGAKLKISSGLLNDVSTYSHYTEAELFYFFLLPQDINLASHLFAGSNGQRTVGSLYYLGGFDSIRGLPDGIHYGNKMLYGNFEARMVVAKYKYAHIQPTVFVDTGSTWMDHANLNSGQEASVGGGVRISIPQIYRFVIRADYGISIGQTKSRGFSIGLNQFFQPYKLVF